MAKTWRVGIIGRTGKGDYGHAVDMAITKLPNVEIVAVADEHEGGRAAAQKFNEVSERVGFPDRIELAL